MKKQNNKIIVAFHTGRGGRFFNAGHKKYVGEKSFMEIIKDNENHIYITNRDENGKYIKPIITDASGNEVSDNKINDETRILNFDGEYDTTESKYIEDCTKQEINLIIESEKYKSEELKEYLNIYAKYDI